MTVFGSRAGAEPHRRQRAFGAGPAAAVARRACPPAPCRGCRRRSCGGLCTTTSRPSRVSLGRDAAARAAIGSCCHEPLMRRSAGMPPCARVRRSRAVTWTRSWTRCGATMSLSAPGGARARRAKPASTPCPSCRSPPGPVRRPWKIAGAWCATFVSSPSPALAAGTPAAAAVVSPSMLALMQCALGPTPTWASLTVCATWFCTSHFRSAKCPRAACTPPVG